MFSGTFRENRKYSISNMKHNLLSVDEKNERILKFIKLGKLAEFSKLIKKVDPESMELTSDEYLSLCIELGRTKFFKHLLVSCRRFRDYDHYNFEGSEEFKNVHSETKIELLKAVKKTYPYLDFKIAADFLISARPNADLPLLRYFSENNVYFEDCEILKARRYPLAIKILQFVASFRPDLIEDVLSLGIDVNNVGFFGHTALLEAVRHGEIQSAEILIKNNASIVNLEKGISHLMVAAIYGQLEMIKFLLSKGFDINEKDEHGRNAFFWAAMFGQVQVLKFLIEKGANTDSHKRGMGPLYWSIVSFSYGRLNPMTHTYHQDSEIFGDEFRPYLGCREEVCTILKYLITVCFDMRDLLYAINVAMEMNIQKAFDILVQHKNFDINYINTDSSLFHSSEGFYVLLKAMMESTKYVKLAIALGADVNFRNPIRKRTPIAEAILIGSPQVALLLLQHGAKGDLAGPDGRTGLMEAASNGCKDLVKKMIEMGCDINQLDKILDFEMIPRRHLGTVMIFMDHGANPDPVLPGVGSCFDYMAKFRSN